MHKEQGYGGREGEGHSPVAASGIAPVALASWPRLTAVDGLRGCSVLEIRGVQLYCCTRVGGNTASIKYIEFRGTLGPQ